MIILTKDSDTVILRSPEWGNTETYDDKVIVRELRGGVTKTFRDSNWITERIFDYTILRLTDSVISQFRTFIGNHVGESITLTDHNDSVFTGYILNNTFNIVTIKDTCSYDISFEFLVESEDLTIYNIVTEDSIDIVTEDDQQIVTERL